MNVTNYRQLTISTSIKKDQLSAHSTFRAKNRTNAMLSLRTETHNIQEILSPGSHSNYSSAASSHAGLGTNRNLTVSIFIALGFSDTCSPWGFFPQTALMTNHGGIQVFVSQQDFELHSPKDNFHNTSCSCGVTLVYSPEW